MGKAVPKFPENPEEALRGYLGEKGFSIAERLPKLSPRRGWKALFLAVNVNDAAPQTTAFVVWRSRRTRRLIMEFFEPTHHTFPHEDVAWFEERYGIVISDHTLNQNTYPKRRRGRPRERWQWEDVVGEKDLAQLARLNGSKVSRRPQVSRSLRPA